MIATRAPSGSSRARSRSSPPSSRPRDRSPRRPAPRARARARSPRRRRRRWRRRAARRALPSGSVTVTVISALQAIRRVGARCAQAICQSASSPSARAPHRAAPTARSGRSRRPRDRATSLLWAMIAATSWVTRPAGERASACDGLLGRRRALERRGRGLRLARRRPRSSESRPPRALPVRALEYERGGRVAHGPVGLARLALEVGGAALCRARLALVRLVGRERGVVVDRARRTASTSRPSTRSSAARCRRPRSSTSVVVNQAN